MIDFNGEPANPYTPASSDTFGVNDLPGILEVNNGSGASITVTQVDGSTTPNGTPAAAIAGTTVTAGQKQRFKLTAAYAGSGQTVQVNFSATTTVTCDFYRI